MNLFGGIPAFLRGEDPENEQDMLAQLAQTSDASGESLPMMEAENHQQEPQLIDFANIGGTQKPNPLVVSDELKSYLSPESFEKKQEIANKGAPIAASIMQYFPRLRGIAGNEMSKHAHRTGQARNELSGMYDLQEKQRQFDANYGLAANEDERKQTVFDMEQDLAKNPSAAVFLAESIKQVKPGYSTGKSAQALDEMAASNNYHALMNVAKNAGITEESAFKYKQLHEQQKTKVMDIDLGRDRLGLDREKFDYEKNKINDEDDFQTGLRRQQAKDFSKLQTDSVKIDEQIGLMDDAIKSFENYSKSSKLGGTGPLATGFGLKKYVDEDTQALDAKFKQLNLQDMVDKFAGMSRAIDTEADRRAYESQRPSISNDELSNYQLIYGSKSLMMKTKAEADAQQKWVSKSGNLDDYKSPIIGKVTSVVNPKTREMQLVRKSDEANYIKNGWMGIDEFSRMMAK